jgi:hypothetical protein
MSDEMYEEWLDYYLDAGGSGVAGSEAAATEIFRQSSTYESYFPGIKRDDGTIRYAYNPEQTYYANINAFRDTVTGLGLNPDAFSEDYIDVIRGDKSPLEFAQNANTLYERVISQGANIREWYADNTGVPMTDEGILASIMSERMENSVLERRITMAEIGGEASMRNYDLTREFVTQLEQAGMSREEAQREFGNANSILPVLQSLAARHGNPDDPFDIYDLLNANVLMDAEQMKLIRTYGAQEETLFTGGAQVELARTQAGGLGGLEAV